MSDLLLEPFHPWSFRAGWLLVLAGFLSGALLGLGFHREGFLGGYGSLRRRLARLGHVACVALGMLNVLYALAPWPAPGTAGADVASLGLLVGGAAMPLACLLVAWRPALRPVFALPIAALIAGAGAVLFASLESLS